MGRKEGENKKKKKEKKGEKLAIQVRKRLGNDEKEVRESFSLKTTTITTTKMMQM